MTDTRPPLAAGASQSVLRNHNERLLLSMIRKHAPIPASDLTRRVSLSAQTVSVILRDLEREGLLERGEPVRGRVGKPSIPMALSPEGAFSIGMKIGRRTASITLVDLAGRIRDLRWIKFSYPQPAVIFEFFRQGYEHMISEVPENLRDRIRGVGLASPYEMWKWPEFTGTPEHLLAPWRDVRLTQEMKAITDLPVHIMNDVTAACRAEQQFGAGQTYRDYAYFFVGWFIGGGISLNGNVIDGNRGNAGALSSLQSVDEDGRPVQLIDRASLNLLERQLLESGIDPSDMWDNPDDNSDDWSGFEPHLSVWIDRTAHEIAKASLSVCAVLDFQAIVVDGAFPSDVRHRLVLAIKESLDLLDTRGLLRPEIVSGAVGRCARVMGAGYAPISSEFFSAPNGQAQLAYV